MADLVQVEQGVRYHRFKTVAQPPHNTATRFEAERVMWLGCEKFFRWNRWEWRFHIGGDFLGKEKVVIHVKVLLEEVGRFILSSLSRLSFFEFGTFVRVGWVVWREGISSYSFTSVSTVVCNQNMESEILFFALLLFNVNVSFRKEKYPSGETRRRLSDVHQPMGGWMDRM